MSNVLQRMVMRALQRLIPMPLSEEAIGDWLEMRQRRLSRSSRVLATLLSLMDAVTVISASRRRHPQTGRISLDLVRSWVWSASRDLVHNRAWSLFNVVGLALGLATALLVGMHLLHEWSFDRHVERPDEVFRIVTDETTQAGVVKAATSHMPLLDGLPDPSEATRFHPYPSLLVLDGNRKSQEENVVFVDSTFFFVFPSQARAGRLDGALTAPGSVVVTHSTARRWFGDQSAVGQNIVWKGARSSVPLTVTAVVEDVPETSHFTYDVLINMTTLLTVESHRNSWYWPPVHTYIRLSSAAARQELDGYLANVSASLLPQTGLQRSLSRQSLLDIHLASDRLNELRPAGNRAMLRALWIVAALVLLIATVNFLNMATVQGATRMRDASIRRALGADRGVLFLQFMVSTLMACAAAGILALILVWLLLPFAERLTGASYSMAALLSPGILTLFTGTLVVIGLATGVYPAIQLARLSPKSAHSHGRPLRRTLIVGQFGMACIMVMLSVSMHRQLDIMLRESTGFDREHVIAVPLRDTEDQMSHASLKEAWLGIPGIGSVSASSGFPGLDGGIHDFQVVLDSAPTDSIDVYVLTVDPEWTDTYGLELVAGQSFSQDRKNGFVINERAARLMGLSDPVGTDLSLIFHVYDEVVKEGSIIGVVRDFQYHSLHREPDPLVLHVYENSFYNDYVSAKLTGHDIPGTLSSMETIWEDFNPDRPFEFTFVDDVFNDMYAAEVRLARTLRVLTLLSLVLAAFGIFSVAAWTILRRNREIGIRKALGASTERVLVTLTSEYIGLVTVACMLAGPIAWIVVQRWLDTYAVAAQPSMIVMMGAAATTVICGLSTVGLLAFRAARQRPVTCLRSET